MTAEDQLETPVALVIFKRPERTRLVFDRIRRARPKRLFLIADGPRAGNEEERLGCEQARAVVEAVDWPCEVTRDFAEGNIGLKRRLPSGLDGVFRQVERAIVLEDDCLPHESFFRFCDELLERYADGGPRHARRREPAAGPTAGIERELPLLALRPHLGVGDLAPGLAHGSTSSSASGSTSTALSGRRGSGRCSPRNPSAVTGATSGTTAVRSRTGTRSGRMRCSPSAGWRPTRIAT